MDTVSMENLGADANSDTRKNTAGKSTAGEVDAAWDTFLFKANPAQPAARRQTGNLVARPAKASHSAVKSDSDEEKCKNLVRKTALYVACFLAIFMLLLLPVAVPAWAVPKGFAFVRNRIYEMFVDNFVAFPKEIIGDFVNALNLKENVNAFVDTTTTVCKHAGASILAAGIMGQEQVKDFFHGDKRAQQAYIQEMREKFDLFNTLDMTDLSPKPAQLYKAYVAINDLVNPLEKYPSEEIERIVDGLMVEIKVLAPELLQLYRDVKELSAESDSFREVADLRMTNMIDDYESGNTALAHYEFVLLTTEMDDLVTRHDVANKKMDVVFLKQNNLVSRFKEISAKEQVQVDIAIDVRREQDDRMVASGGLATLASGGNPIVAIMAAVVFGLKKREPLSLTEKQHQLLLESLSHSYTILRDAREFLNNNIEKVRDTKRSLKNIQNSLDRKTTPLAIKGAQLDELVRAIQGVKNPFKMIGGNSTSSEH